MRLAINAVSIAPGGGLNVLLGYLEAWREIGADLEITVFASRPAVLEAVAVARPDVRCVPFAQGASPARHFLLQQRALGRAVEAARAQVVLTTNTPVGRCAVPQVIHQQNLKRFLYRTPIGWLREGQPREAVKDWYARRGLARSAANAYISDYLRRAAERFVPASAPRNHVVYNGLPKATLEAAERAGNGWNGEPHLAAIQAPARHKDNPTLLRTLARLTQLAPRVPWTLSVAGGGDWSPFQALARRLGIGDRVRFLGHLDDAALDAMLRRSVCLVYPSVLEGFGIPPIEAMARRCPPVACRATAIPEVVGDAGILVEPGDADGFAAAVLRLFEDRSAREALVERGLAQIQRFRWVDSARRMAEILHRAAGR